jgi:hypothetical protein
LLYRKLGGLCAFQDLIYIAGGAPEHITIVDPRKR